MISKLIHKYLDSQYKDVDRFVSNPIETQEAVFNYLLKNGRNTMFGAEHGFNSLKNKDEFRKKCQ